MFFARIWYITKDDYDKKLQELKDSQYRLNIELEEHTKADYDYKISLATVFNLCSNVEIIFESSEVPEKRALLNFLLQNPMVSGKKLEFTLRKPFNAVLELAGCSNWLARWDDFRTLRWLDVLSYPDGMVSQAKQILQVTGD